MDYKDIQIDIYRTGTDLRQGSNAVRITHIPTGIL
jgi:protein subunit release factor A